MTLIAINHALWITELEKLFTLLSLPLPSQRSQDIQTLHAYHKSIQRYWLRPAHLERCELKDIPAYHAHRATLLSIFKRMGLISQHQPRYTKYDHLLLLGALKEQYKQRVTYLKECLAAKQIEISTFYLLGSTRPLRSQEQYKTATTEAEMMYGIYQQHINTPSSPCTVTIPMLSNKRPNTLDTIYGFQALQPAANNILAVSSQPHIAYQAAVIKHVFPQSNLDTIGPATAPHLTIAEILDAIARTLYQTLDNQGIL